MRAVISSIFSNGNGGWESGFIAIDISFMGLSSAATRFELKCPHLLHRWMIAHSPFFLTQTLTPTGADSGKHYTAPERMLPIVFAASRLAEVVT